MGLAALAATVTGSGQPVTVAAHGLGASVAETRPLLSGITGTRVFYAARAHAGDVPEPFTYRDLGDDLLTVADHHDATRALGVSMGAGAILSVLSRHPARFEKVVLFLPGAIDRPRTDDAVRRFAVLVDAIHNRDEDGVRDFVEGELPPELRPGAAGYIKDRARFLLSSPGIPTAVASLPPVTPVDDRSSLAAVAADVLVLAQEGDPLHPAQVARDLAAVLPKARLTVFERPGVMIRERSRLRALISDFLND
ncbi:MAG: alpha/beta hydrolase fold protein [Frankiales bacterium]|nr:alpha/beta hydrolase fold protein [Frankiales bacterium]